MMLVQLLQYKTMLGMCRLLCLLCAMVLASCTLPEPVAPGSVKLSQGHWAYAQSKWPQGDLPAPASAWEMVTLPDAWDTHRPLFQGYVWYRFTFDTPKHWSEPLAIYLPYASMNAMVVLNGQVVGLQGRMTEPVTRNFYTPLIFPATAPMFKPAGQTNELRVLLMGYRSYRSGLAPVWIGPAPALQSAWDARHFWQNTGTLITSVVVLSAALFGVILWMRMPRNAMFAWFTLAALVWGVRNLNFVLTDNPWDNTLWNQWSVTGATTFVGLFALLCMAFSQWVLKETAVYRWRLVLPIAYILVSMVLFVTPDDTALVRKLFFPLSMCALLLMLWSQWVLLRTARLVRTGPVWGVAIAGLIYFAFAINDIAVANDHVTVGGLFLRQYAAVPLFVSLTWVWAQRYWQALHEAERLSESLHQQVAKQRVLLEQNFAKLVQVEREQVLSQERERLVSDLHDGLGLHLLTALKMARQGKATSVQLADTLQDCLDDLRMAIDSMSNLDDRDPVLILGSLRFRFAPRLQALGVQLDWDVQGTVAPQPWLDATHALHLMRIVQEALTNAVRHGRATRILLSVQAMGQGVCVSVADNGIGMPSDLRFGHGLNNMKRRAQAMGASLDIQSVPEIGGTEIRLTRT